MKYNDALVVPTLGNKKLLETLIDSINYQTEDSFDFILVVNQKTDKNELFSFISNISDKKIEIITQQGEGIIDAMNKALSLNYNNIILTDDDAMPNQDYIYNSLNALESNKGTGCVFGQVNGKFPDSRRNKISRFVNSYCSTKSLLRGKANRYFNLAGLPVGNILSSSPKKDVIDYLPIGVSMSWKQSNIKGLKIPIFSKRGIFFESYMSMAFYLKGLDTRFINNISVKHLDNNSLSRGPSSIDERIIDIYRFPFALYELGFDIKTEKLKKILPLLDILSLNKRKLKKSIEETISEIESRKRS